MIRGTRTVAVGSIVALGAVAFAVGGAPSMASADTLTYTVDCAHAISVTANVGDTLVFTMVHPGCNGANPNTGNFANFNNLNGTYFDGIGSGWEGTATSSGFLEYVSHTEGTATNTDYWHNHGGADDWYVMQTASTSSTNPVVITTTLRDHDGASNPLVVGSVLGDIFLQPMGVTTEYLITYAGPRTDGADSESESSSSSASAELSDTGFNGSPWLFGALGVVAFGAAAGLVARSLKRKSGQS